MSVSHPEEPSPDIGFTDEQEKAIKIAVDIISDTDSQNLESVILILQTVPDSGPEIMLQLRDKFGEGDPVTSLILSGVLLNELADRIEPETPRWTHE